MRRLLWWQWLLLIVFLPVISFELYCRWPSNATVSSPQVSEEVSQLILLFHGTNGSEDRDWLRLADVLAEGAKNNKEVQVENVIWSPWSDNQFRASANAESIAAKLGLELASLEQLSRVHLFASSAGSYLLEPICELLKAKKGDAVTVVMTYLDPIGIKGSLDFTYGYRNYGRCADFAEVYLNTDDAVPGTNAPAEQAFNLDITDLKFVNEFTGNGHVWPVVYYTNQLVTWNGVPRYLNHTKAARGAVNQPE